MDYQEALDKYLVSQVSIYPPFFSPLWIKTSNFNPTIYSDKIFYYENVIFHPDKILEALEESDPSLKDSDAIGPWKPWVAKDEVTLPSGIKSDYVFGETKTTSPKKYLTSSPEVQFAFGQIKNSITFTTDHYISILGISPGKMSTLMISKYFTNSELGLHTDSYRDNAYISACLYLNDDYEGGELVFPEQDIVIKPSAGSVVVFPSTEPFFHQVNKVTSGEKYICSAFLFKD